MEKKTSYQDEVNRDTNAAIRRIKEKEIYLNSIRGCMVGGAVGDALGYAIEFWDEDQIFGTFGEGGITEYKKDYSSQKALISDDTQMSLFTANGILVGDTRICLRGIGASPRCYVSDSYQDWLLTQEITYEESRNPSKDYLSGGWSWLLDVPGLYALRSPGVTCLAALKRQKKEKDHVSDYIKNPKNDSKGCGGIMRVAPLALAY